MSNNANHTGIFSGFHNWWAGIDAYFRFLVQRRRDYSAPVFANISRILLFIVVCVAICIALVWFVDEHYLAYVRDPSWRAYPVFELITRLGKVWWLLILTAAVIVLMSFFTADRFKGAAVLVWHRIMLNAVFLFVSVAGSGILVLLFKNVVGRARPRFTPLTDIWHSVPFTDHYLYASFPSGHSTTGGAIAMALAMLFPRWRYFFILAGISIAFSRPALGVHFPSDAFAGFVLGCSFVYFYARSLARMRLIFHFDKNGALALRGEHKLPARKTTQTTASD